MDSIEINGIRVYGYTGYLPEERTLGQWFTVDLTLWVDLRAAGQSDRLEDTLDYRQAISIVRTQIETQRYALLETLGDRLAKDLLELPGVDRLRLRLCKEAPPIPNFAGSIVIDLVRP